MNILFGSKARRDAFPSKESEITALSVLCPVRATPRGQHCRGALVRMQDGEGRLSELCGRVVLKCDRCGTRWSVLIQE